MIKREVDDSNTGSYNDGTEQDGTERAVLIGVEISQDAARHGKTLVERSLDELEELASTAGAITLQKIFQKRNGIDAAFYAGKGFIEKLNEVCAEINANLIIFDDELSGTQLRNIEKLTDIKVIDRTALILDIFAGRAKSREGKLQVELAQLKYRLPRLTGLGGQLSRLGGGIGTRGPGEKKLESDRRHLRRRISQLERELKLLAERRNRQRNTRRKNMVPVIALVGYTNAGKSTLLNKLCGSDVYVEEKLFATLDPTSRKLNLPDGRNVIMVDTVGFIKKLPHDLVEAFKSTLEEVVYADVLIHVLDVSSEERDSQAAVVNNLLFEFGVLEKPLIIALNKIDALKERERIPVYFAGEAVCEISAVTGEGIEKLLELLCKALPPAQAELLLRIPYSDGWVMPFLHENGEILETNYLPDGAEVKVKIKMHKVGKIKQYAEHS